MNYDREPEPSARTPAPSTAASAVAGASTQVPAVGNPPAPGPAPSTPPPAVIHASPTQLTTHDRPVSGSNGSQPASIRQNTARRKALSFGGTPFDDYGPHGLGSGNPLPPLPDEFRPRDSRVGAEAPVSLGLRSDLDYLVPVDEKASRERTVGDRLEPTLLTAIAERDKYAFKAKMTGYALNIAIGLQVLLGALTTGLSAAATTGRQAAISTTILGALATLVASYLARARGSNEPELSITRVKDLEQFIRECEAFKMDRGHTLGNTFDGELDRLRRRFEELLGNANGERKLAPPA
ncbi:hypothetical protein LshimejAT787_1201840 [Lyophyllum shimeji]|uniref:SMODS and SLOG-associating 2TM effector domain-containing protein n=1 Tax=Lyophyllum shimeji TaxID=47721 RepID=A0A9P3PTT2_LYOSH|nr:hypothetical protein LshimejAT787_1201840 [Lyophyllum shimeji]